jgi:hypothetical protein
MKWLILTLLCFTLAPYVFKLAYGQRGYSAVGGEIFILILPVVIYMLVPIFREWSDEK